jgi:hypothetical protein
MGIVDTVKEIVGFTIGCILVAVIMLLTVLVVSWPVLFSLKLLGFL